MIPPNLKAIADYLSATVLGERKSGTPRLLSPSLLAGPRGTGKSWVLSEVRQRISSQADKTGIYPVEVPWSLSAETLIDSIERGIARARLNKTGTGLLAHQRQDKFLLFLEDIDVFFNPKRIDAPFRKPKGSKGGGAALYSQIRNANRLRAFLIERHETVSILATAGDDLRFLEDSDLPFFQFFNVINVEPMSPEHTLALIKSKLDRNWTFTALIDSLTKLSPGFHHRLTDGKLLFINSIVDAIWDLQVEGLSLNQPADDIISHFLSLYFHRLDPHMSAMFDNLSGLERQVIDGAVLLGDVFSPAEIPATGVPALARLLPRLVDKQVFARESARVSRYKFNSSTMKAYLRFRRKMPLSQVINPQLRAD